VIRLIRRRLGELVVVPLRRWPEVRGCERCGLPRVAADLKRIDRVLVVTVSRSDRRVRDGTLRRVDPRSGPTRIGRDSSIREVLADRERAVEQVGVATFEPAVIVGRRWS
jgi:hypothetical protein